MSLNRQKDFEKFRKDNPVFIFDSFTITKNNDSATAKFNFIIPNLMSFHPSITFPYSSDAITDDFLHYLIFNIGMVELISYWKCVCSPKVQVNCGYLNEKQIQWWKKLYMGGLGEFFYRNGITTTVEDFMNIETNPEKKYYKQNNLTKIFFGNLIPVGGGKDSIVTLELLKPRKKQNTCFIMNPRGATLETVTTAGYKISDTVCIDRQLDLGIVDMNKKGYLNGHTPFSALLAFSAYLCAYIKGKKFVILSNESSANESYVSGAEVNHQYSKSIEFENDFRYYCKNFLDERIEYFSLLRPLNEWQIVKQFVKHQEYFNVFKSCNLGSKTNSWCGKCSKCLYVYIMLSPFLSPTQMKEIFSKNLLNDEEMLDDFKGLVSEQFDKPFECVGTREEINHAVAMTITKYTESGLKLPLLLKYYKDNFSLQKYRSVESFFDNNNNVPFDLLKIIKEQIYD